MWSVGRGDLRLGSNAVLAGPLLQGHRKYKAHFFFVHHIFSLVNASSIYIYSRVVSLGFSFLL